MPSGPKSDSARAVTMLIAATFFWGASFPVTRALQLHQSDLSPAVNSIFLASAVVLCRFGVAALALALWRGRNFAQCTGLEVWQGAGLAFFGGVGILLQTDALNFIHASTSAFLTQSYCVWVPVAVACRRREWPTKTLALSCAMVLGGLAILTDLHPSNLRLGRGEMETILGSLFFTGQILWLERPLFARCRVVPMTMVMFGLTALVILPFALATSRGPSEWAAIYHSRAAIGFTLFLALFCTVIPYTLMNFWQQHISAAHASLIYAFEPLITSVLTLFLPAWLAHAASVNYSNEVIGQNLLIGGGLVIAANLLVWWQSSRKVPVPAQANSNP